MNRYRALNPSSANQGPQGGSSALPVRQTPNPFSSLPYSLPPIAPAPVQYSVTQLNSTDFIPGLSGQNIYDPNLTADEIR
jgi:hypothetical protein